MASWKMAKAFGRAMSERMGKDGKAAKAVNNSEIAKAANNGVWNDKDIEAIDAYRKGQREGNENFYVGREAATEDAMNRMDPDAKRIWENYDLDYERAYGPEDAYRRAVELSGVEDAPSSISSFYDRYGFDIADRPTPRNSDISRSISRVEDQNSDVRLQKDFDDAFSEAAENHGYNRWRKEAGNKPVNDGLGGEIHNLEREGAVDDVRGEMIDELKNKTSDISDVLSRGPRNLNNDVNYIADLLRDRNIDDEEVEFLLDYYDTYIRDELRKGSKPEDIIDYLDRGPFRDYSNER